jgi:hypothetical protein
LWECIPHEEGKEQEEGSFSGAKASGKLLPESVGDSSHGRNYPVTALLFLAIALMFLLGIMACYYEQKWTDMKIKYNDLLWKMEAERGSD